jgi:hypothetical protein
MPPQSSPQVSGPCAKYRASTVSACSTAYAACSRALAARARSFAARCLSCASRSRSSASRSPSSASCSRSPASCSRSVTWRSRSSSRRSRSAAWHPLWPGDAVTPTPPGAVTSARSIPQGCTFRRYPRSTCACPSRRPLGGPWVTAGDISRADGQHAVAVPTRGRVRRGAGAPLRPRAPGVTGSSTRPAALAPSQRADAVGQGEVPRSFGPEITDTSRGGRVSESEVVAYGQRGARPSA